MENPFKSNDDKKLEEQLQKEADTENKEEQA